MITVSSTATAEVANTLATQLSDQDAAAAISLDGATLPTIVSIRPLSTPPSRETSGTFSLRRRTATKHELRTFSGRMLDKLLGVSTHPLSIDDHRNHDNHRSTDWHDLLFAAAAVEDGQSTTSSFASY